MKQLFGSFDLITNEYVDSSTNVYSYNTDEVELYTLGRIETDENVNDGCSVIKLFKSNKEKITERISGLYIAIFFEKASGSLYVFHDRTTSPLTLYYTQKEDKLYFSTSLKTLIVNSGIKATFNESVIKEFLTNGYIYGESTLIKNVYKLKAFNCLKVHGRTINQVAVSYTVKDYSKGKALENFKSVLDKAILKSIDGINDISMPLSAGYDSNYICHIITENANKNTTGFSIGGKHGKNEVPTVQENAKLYKDLQLKTAITDANTLKNFPDIIWRLEGNVYECGLFLQYELARLVNSNGKHSLICGECADQVMNINYLSEDRINVISSADNPKYYEFSEYPYIFGSYLILKKNGILSNSFDIETRYPYLDADVVSVSNALKYLNMKDKRVHVANCKECLPPQIVDNMTKIGGSTDCHSLFNSVEDIKRFFNRIENAEFYQQHKDIIKSCSQTEKEKQMGLAAIKTKIRNVVCNMLHLQRNDGYFFEEMQLREYLCVAYLAIFDELFISGKYNLAEKQCLLTFDEVIN